MPRYLSANNYTSLIRQVKQVLKYGLVAAQKAVEYQRVKTYWTIGRTITDAVEASNGALAINEELYVRISKDVRTSLKLNLSRNTIQRAIQFSHEYPTFPENTPLSFTHYLALMRVDDPKERARLEKEARQKDLTTPALKRKVNAINLDVLDLIKTEAGDLTVEHGEPYVYVTRTFKDLSGEADMAVDCGFKIHVPLKGSIITTDARFNRTKSRYVSVRKTNDKYHVTLATRKRHCVHTYVARVTRVVDGDTLDAMIDVGFGIRVEERFRLKGIDAPEIHTALGQKAKRFLTRYLKKAPIVIVRTLKEGMYGRWLGDLFALPGTTDPHTIAKEGEYINALMMREGLVEGY